MTSSAAAWTVLLSVLAAAVVVASMSAHVDESLVAAAPTPALDAPVAVSTVPAITTTTVLPPGSCFVTIGNGKAPLFVAPDPSSREMLTVPAGNYVVAAAQPQLSRAEQRWLLIEVGGVSGWVRDRSGTIDQRSAACV